MSELTPITRVESYLDAIVNSGIPPLDDITRIETFLQAIYDNQVCALTPVTRIEMFLGKISGQDIELPQPVTRAELYLAAIAGEDVELPENPITRLEMYLAEWADSGDWTTISGAIVEFITQRAHKLKSCVVSLSPQQDLHGYDSPWPEGGGDNKLPPYSSETQNDVMLTADSEGNITLNGTASAVCRFNLVFDTAIPSGSYYISFFNTAMSGVEFILLNSGGTAISDIVLSSANYRSVLNASADIASLRIYIASGTQLTNAKLSPMLVSGNTAPTAFKPYSNICPISGWTGCEVFVDGKNLLDQSKCLSKHYITATGNIGGSDDWSASDYTPIKGGQTYTFSGYTATGWTACHAFYDSDKNFISSEFAINHSTFTAPNNAAYVRLSIKSETPTVAMLELGSTVTDYEPYNGNAYSVTWEDEAGTVYGGSVDLVSGVLTINRKSVFLSAFNFNLSSAENHVFRSEYLQVIPDIISHDDGIRADYGDICDSFGYKAWTPINANDNGKFSISVPSSNRIVFVDHRFSLTADFVNAVKNVRLCYYLATPITIQLTPQQITALKGYNAVWSDGGDIEVTVHGTPVELSTQQALNMLLGGAYHNAKTQDDVPDDEALDIILGGEQR